jgi:hypothetical protein
MGSSPGGCPSQLPPPRRIDINTMVRGRALPPRCATPAVVAASVSRAVHRIARMGASLPIGFWSSLAWLSAHQCLKHERGKAFLPTFWMRFQKPHHNGNALASRRTVRLAEEIICIHDPGTVPAQKLAITAVHIGYWLCSTDRNAGTLRKQRCRS